MLISECCDHFSQVLKVMFFTIGAIYLVYLIYLLFRAYSELRAMPYFGKLDIDVRQKREVVIY